MSAPLMDGRRALLLSRRAFLRTGALAGTALVIGCRVPGRGESAAAAAKHALNAWVTIDTAGQVTVWLGKSEMGQGVRTSLPMIVAEELDVEWATVGIEQALSNQKVYGSQGTGGSSSVRRSIQPLRKAGAAAREMLIAAAAQSWGVPLEECRAEKGMVLHEGRRRKAPYGELVEAASKLPVPESPRLKEPKDFRIIGTRTPRLDTPSKVDGRAVYGIDFRVPGMLFAAVARAPVFGARVVSFDAARARVVPGVRDVVQIDTGVAVVADTTWSAFQGREVLEIRWERGPHATLDSAAIQRKLEQMTVRSGATARREGDAAGALARSARRVEAVYELPYLAHAPMEPMNCTAHVRADLCEIWAPTQVPNEVQEVGATITGLPAEAVRVHTTLLGGGFGRRLDCDDASEAVRVSKAIGAPVKVVWSREDDMRHGFLRPASRHRLRGGLDREGRPIAWQHRIVAPSIIGQRWPEEIKKGLDSQAVEGAANIPYGIPNILVDYVMANTAVPTSWWRSVYNSQNGFVNESFIDELAVAAGKDPVEFRLSLLTERRVLPDEDGVPELDTARLRGIIELVAAKAGWGGALPQGRGRGIAAHFSFGSYAAQVAEVTVSPGGALRVDRFVCAIDCGMVINPDTIEAQMQGSVVFGLAAALKGAITIAGGAVEQGNFDGYEMLRIDEMPVVETHILPSAEPCGGVGEPAVPPVAPALTNAIFAATGKRIRRLPIRGQDLTRT